MPEFQMPTFTPSRPTRITRRPVVHFNGHVNPLPLATVPAQSDEEKALHLDPEYAELIRISIAGHREYRERDPWIRVRWRAVRMRRLGLLG